MRIAISSQYLDCPDPIHIPCIHLFWYAAEILPFGLESYLNWSLGLVYGICMLTPEQKLIMKQEDA